MLQVVKSESGFGQRQQSSPNRQQQKRKGDNFGDEDPTERVFMDSLRLRLLALVKSVGQKRCDGSNTTKTSAGSACVFFSWFVVPEKSQPKTAACCLRRLRCRL